MATLTIRNLDEETKKRLRQLAARHGHSMEEEARRILNRAVHQDERQGIGSLIHSRFEAVGGVDLEIPPRSSVRPAPALVDDVP